MADERGEQGGYFPGDAALAAWAFSGHADDVRHRRDSGVVRVSSAANGGQTDDNGNTNFVFAPTSHPFSRPDMGVYNDPGRVVMTLWDGFGDVDAIVASDMNYRVLIDLRAGEFSSIGRDNLLERNVGIAIGATIEQAWGGTGNDVLRGNQVANRLEGNAGADMLDGGTAIDAGDAGVPRGEGDNQVDTLRGGAGADIYVLRENGGLDVVDDDGITDHVRFRDQNDQRLAFVPIGLRDAPDATSWHSLDGRWSYERSGTALVVTDTTTGAKGRLLNFYKPAFTSQKFRLRRKPLARSAGISSRLILIRISREFRPPLTISATLS
jgi:hypothetical protein